MDEPNAVGAMDRLTVAHLVRSPGLELTVLAGADALSRQVSWAHVSELEDPTPWLLGAELVMTTGLAVPRGARAQRAYVERLDDGGVAALAISEGLNMPPLTPEFLAAADERGLPVLEVPLSVPFISLAQAVAVAVHDETRGQVVAQMQVFGTLRALAFDEMNAAEIFERLQHGLGYRFYLCTPTGESLLPGVPPPPPAARRMIPSSPRQPPAVQGGFALPVPSPTGNAGYLLALPRADVRGAGLPAVQSMAIVAALMVSMRRQTEEIARRQGAETLAELLAGVLDETTARTRVASRGLAAGGTFRLWAVSARDDGGRDGIVQAFWVRGVKHLMLRQEAHELVLCEDTPSAREAFTAAGAAGAVSAGCSGPFSLSARLAVPRSEALRALDRALESGRGVVEFDGEPTDRWLTRDRAAIEDLVGRCLGPALGYDATHRSEVVRSVRVWLEANRRQGTAASALGIHPNTLAYRLQRFEELTGKNLEETGDVSEVWLALRAHAQVSQYDDRPPLGPPR